MLKYIYIYNETKEMETIFDPEIKTEKKYIIKETYKRLLKEKQKGTHTQRHTKKKSRSTKYEA